MSLLLDALKRAEQSRQQTERASPREMNAPIDKQALAALALAELEERPSTRDSSARADTNPAFNAAIAAETPSDIRQAQREAAKLLFDVKANQEPKPRYALLASLFLAGVFGISVWVWQGLQARSTIRPTSDDATRLAHMPVQPKIEPPAENASHTASTSNTAEVATTTVTRSYTNTTSSETTPTADTYANTPRWRSIPAGGDAHLTRTPSVAVPDNIARGYEALRSNDLNSARAAYQQAYQSDPNNTDALHGLATLALREKQPNRAESIYRRILELDPTDADATAALNILRRKDNSESTLRSAMAQQPDTPATHFALGNLLAGEQRWREAQQAYFNACAGDPSNPDYAFNLAVSLEHLHQPAQAAVYYARAINTSRSRAAAFSSEQAQTRLKAIQSALETGAAP